jgi:hypothetical protein
MPYTAEISRSNPTCFLFLIDQSKSMRGPLGSDPSKSKAQAVADSLNHLLFTLSLRCVWGQNILDRFHIGVIGYGGEVNNRLGGALAGRELAPISEIARNPLRVEQRTSGKPGQTGMGEQTIKFPVWLDPLAEGKTPMAAALEKACLLVGGFLAEHPDCYPPLVINISDGEATDSDPRIPAGKLTALSSNDGQVLLFNIHLSSNVPQAIEFPDRLESLPDKWSRHLFEMSSVLPPPMQGAARQAGIPVTSTTRGFVFNANLASVVRFLDIGTRIDLKNTR